MSRGRTKTADERSKQLWRLINAVLAEAEGAMRSKLAHAEYIAHVRTTTGQSATGKLQAVCRMKKLGVESRFRAGWLVLLIISQETFPCGEDVLFQIMREIPLLQRPGTLRLMRLLEGQLAESEFLLDMYYRVPWRDQAPRVSVLKRLLALRRVPVLLFREDCPLLTAEELSIVHRAF